MKILAATTAPLDLPTDLLALACGDDAPAEAPLVAAIDQALGGSLRRAISDERFRGKPGQLVSLHTQGRLAASRVALVGVGPEPRGAPETTALLTFAGRVARLANATGAVNAALVPPAALAASAPAVSSALALGLELGSYRFDKYLSEDKRTPPSLRNAQLLLGDAISAAAAIAAIERGQRVAAAITRARDLVNEPAGFMTPTRLATVAQEIASENSRPMGKLELTVLGPEECAARGMGLFLAVAQGSVEEPRFIHLAWKPAAPRTDKRIVLVGKGVTFDSGGLSLKPSDAMLDMKTDMAGAATVLAALEAVAAEGLPVEVHALAACTENMISGRAYKLGDVLRSKAGKTVEINNTDAEGRLTLADAISYGLELQPTAVLDFATLTGACVVALGPYIAGVMSNDDALASTWLAAAQAAGEEMWRLPLPERLAEQLKSEIADMKNTGERWGGALTAGLFLKEFVGSVPWIHVDLAGPSSTDKELGHVAKGGTGFGVATIVEYLRRVSAA